MSELLGDWLGFAALLASCVAEDIGLAFCCFLAAWLRMMCCVHLPAVSIHLRD